MQRWRFWIVPLGQRERISREDLPEDPLFHIIHHAFGSAWAPADDLARDLLEIHDALTGRPPRRESRGFGREVGEVLYAAIEEGMLKFERHDLVWHFLAKDEKPPSKREAPAAEEKGTFVAIELVDREGNPVSGRRYRLVLPDGTVREGRFDARGRVRIEDIHAGTAELHVQEDVTP